jgi:glycosyltransferase involved in cell wall biosynthesis
MISIVIPTIRGREEHFQRCVAAYESRTVSAFEIIVERDHPAVGPAWNAGAARATGDYLHFTADDLEPHEGWDVPALEVVQRGLMPAPRVINQHGRLDSCGLHGVEMEDWAVVPMSVVPFMSREQWAAIGPVLPIHYFTDNWISWRGHRAGWPTVVRRDFAFTHHWAQHGRGAGMTYDERLRHDQGVFLEAVREAESDGAVRVQR